MKLNKYQLGELLVRSYDTNDKLEYGLASVRGVLNTKKLSNTKADLNGRDLSKFQIVYPGDFVFNHRTSRNGSKFSIAYNDEHEPVICTEDYVVFRIKPECNTILLANWLYMYFNRPEFDRFVITNSWGSSTEFYNWEDLCSIELEIPALDIQKKYVDVYIAMVANQMAYSQGLEDLKIVCDGFIEDLRRKLPVQKIGEYIICTDRKTDDPSLKIQGISNQRKLNDSNSRVDGVDTSKYLRIDPGEFGYSPIHINDGSIAYNDSNESFLISPIYKTFRVNEEQVYPEYLMMWFSREEFTRYCWFHAFGSARDTFDWEQMKEVEIPIPDINVQKSIAHIYQLLIKRKSINEMLKEQIKVICPILIRGSIEEAKKEE